MHIVVGAAATSSLVDKGATSNIASNNNHNKHRELFTLPSPFEFYNAACTASCQGVVVEEEEGNDHAHNRNPFLNACPKCPETYSPCNQCCFGGASSLKIRWHGCTGVLTLTTPEQASEDCGDSSSEAVEEVDDTESLLETTVRFVDCACLDTIVRTTTTGSSSSAGSTTRMGCGLFDSITLAPTILGEQASVFFDICLVSVVPMEPQGGGGGSSSLVLDLSKPLPPVIGIEMVLHHNLESEEQDDGPPMTTTPTLLTTYFDTTCATLPYRYAHPLFPGFGKFPHTCPDKGFIDLELEQHQLQPRLPHAVDHLNGRPPPHAFWFEFRDGTSTGFWPSNNDNNDDFLTNAHSFHPTFATCACADCEPLTISDSEDAASTTTPPLTPASNNNNTTTSTPTTTFGGGGANQGPPGPGFPGPPGPVPPSPTTETSPDWYSDSHTSHDSTSHDSTSHENTSRDSTSHDSTSHDSTSHENTSRDSTSHDSTSRDSTSRDSTSRENTSHDSTSRDSTSRDSTSNSKDSHSSSDEEAPFPPPIFPTGPPKEPTQGPTSASDSNPGPAGPVDGTTHTPSTTCNPAAATSSTTPPTSAPDTNDTIPPTTLGDANQGPPGPGFPGPPGPVPPPPTANNNECQNSGDYAICNHHAIVNCRTRNAAGFPDGATCLFLPENGGNGPNRRRNLKRNISLKRKLHNVQRILADWQQTQSATTSSSPTGSGRHDNNDNKSHTLAQAGNNNIVDKEWLQMELNRHLGEITRLEQQMLMASPLV
jgi:hypothetical protein